MAQRAPDGRDIKTLAGLGLGLLAVSTASLFIRLAQTEGAPALVIAAYRLSIASLILLPVVLWRGRTGQRRLTARSWVQACIAGVALGIHFGAWISSLAFTSVASSVVLVSASPLFAAVIAAVVLHERPTRGLMIGMALSLAGAAVVGLSDTCSAHGCPPVADFVRGPALVGDLLALVGAAAGGVYFTAGRMLRKQLSLTTYIFLAYGVAAVFLVAAAAIAHQPFTGYRPSTYVWFALLALVPQLVGHSSFNRALRHLPAAYVSVTILGEPVGAILLAAVLLGEAPTSISLAGGGLILTGIAVASWAAIATAQPGSAQA